MSQIPNLENAPINLSAIRARAQAELETILKNVRGDKCLVIDPKLSGSLSLLVQSSELKKHGAELRHLTAEPIQTDRTKVVYLVRAQIDLIKFICSHIHNDTSKGLHREYYLYFVPRRAVVCEKVLEEEKVHELLNIGDFPLYMIPLDEDVLSFELDLAQKEYLADGDATSLWHIAKAIHNLEFSFGLIPNVRAKGKAATRVADILNRMQAEEPVNTSDMGIPEINTLVLLDREVDMVTPMCSQLTYEGLLDEFLGVNNGAVELDASIMGVQQEGKKIKVPLNSSDKLFKEIRDLNFEVVVQVLRQKATSMKQDYTEISTTSQTVSELKDFVKKLNSLPEMTRHINLAQHLSTFTSKPSFLGRLDMEQTLVEAQSYDICFDYIEEMIHKQEPLVNVLRLLILFSVTNSGLPKKNFDYLRRELLHSYGFEHIATLNNLEKAGLFRKQDSRSNWLTIKRALQLVVEDTDTANPNDIAYVFSGYTEERHLYPNINFHSLQLIFYSSVFACNLSYRRPIEEILRLLPGPHSEIKRGGYASIPSYETLPGSLNSSEKLADGRRSLVLVVFIGGVTFAEISALRFLCSQEGMAYDLIVGTTKIVNGQALTETFIEKLG
ncbi:vacuolar protein-sorting-associated protein 33 homolog [Sesamum indicum]|uniref:Vacuolar protein-sorting-associated protein 33 homolog n=1 Tax=Sesamum indicum TaxID=4182 RepID=A0A6I9T580_SESIN|nr:vacuolar protein-sorting-associated protein 33 homolog [Sesamum indicum]